MSEDIRLISLDLDGTLLNDEKQVSPANKQALLDCIARGIYIVPTTGRTVDGIPDEVKGIPGVRYAITTNGAIIQDIKERKVLDSRKITWQLAMELLDVISCYHVMYDPYIDGRGISEPAFYDHMSEYGLSSQMQEMVKRTRDVYPNIREFVEHAKKPVEKINLFFLDQKEKARLRSLLEGWKNIVISSSTPNNLELNAPGATKGEAILRLAELLGLRRDQTMGVGDGENDFTMIQKAGVGVAMGNADPLLIQMADYVTGTNEEDGVAAAIRHFVFETEG